MGLPRRNNKNQSTRKNVEQVDEFDLSQYDLDDDDDDYLPGVDENKSDQGRRPPDVNNSSNDNSRSNSSPARGPARNRKSNPIPEDNDDYLPDSYEDQEEDDDYIARDPAPSRQRRTSSTHVPSQPRQDQAPEEERMANAMMERSRRSIELRHQEDNRETRRSHVSELDNGVKLKDGAKKAKVYRIISLIALVAMLALAVWNCLIPKRELTSNDVTSIAMTVSGNTGFPIEEGKGIAQQFIKAYLQSNGDPAASQILGVFYNGLTYENVAKQSGTSGQPTNLEAPSNIRQIIEYGPYVYDAKPVDADGTTATYKLGTIVYRTDENNGNQPIMGADGKTPLYRQLFYEVDIHYNKKNGKFAVFKNSPTMVSAPAVEQPESAPQAETPGNGNEAQKMTTDKTQKLITQFFQAWGDSNTGALSVVTNDNSTVDARKGGLGGTVKISGDPSYHIYEPPAGDPYYRALVTVQWVEKVTDQTTITQTSQYVLKIEKSGKSLYVHDVQPYYYTPMKAAKN